MRALPLIAVAAALVWTAPAFGQSGSREAIGERFVSLCKSPTDAGRDACGGVVTALMVAHVEMARQDPNNRVICPPRMLSKEEGRRVFLQWADITPAAPTMRFPHLVMQALAARYPCTQFIVPK